jgi:serine/threonine-protein kinase RsbW
VGTSHEVMFEQGFAAVPAAAGAARAFVRHSLAPTLSLSQLDAAELLTSELMTNAVRHAGLAPEDQIELSIEVGPTTIHIDVADAGSGFEHATTDHLPDGGWGLILVDTVSDRWGVDGSAPHSVWFELDRVGG